jgi:hypothetical protein
LRPVVDFADVYVKSVEDFLRQRGRPTQTTSKSG